MVGDARASTKAGDRYKVIDYHLLDGSGALDRGTLAGAPGADLEGNPRPGADGRVDLGVYEAPGAYVVRDITKPQSAVLALPALITSARFQVGFAASDIEGAVDHALLYYRLAGGAWTRYGDSFTTTPVAFDTTRTGGDGTYEFHTRAVDDSGNTEDAPAAPDARTLVVTQYAPRRLYVDLNAAATGVGDGWANACTSVTLALGIAKTYGVPEVWVARGRYHEAIALFSGLALYGGFEGTSGGAETQLAQRDPVRNATILEPVMPAETYACGRRKDHSNLERPRQLPGSYAQSGRADAGQGAGGLHRRGARRRLGHAIRRAPSIGQGAGLPAGPDHRSRGAGSERRQNIGCRRPGERRGEPGAARARHAEPD